MSEGVKLLKQLDVLLNGWEFGFVDVKANLEV